VNVVVIEVVAAVKEVVLIHAPQHVGAVPSFEGVVPALAFQDVVAVATPELVIVTAAKPVAPARGAVGTVAIPVPTEEVVTLLPVGAVIPA
jgi:hypothetical protein